jgi:hypothetical protein
MGHIIGPEDVGKEMVGGRLRRSRERENEARIRRWEKKNAADRRRRLEFVEAGVAHHLLVDAAYEEFWDDYLASCRLCEWPDADGQWFYRAGREGTLFTEDRVLCPDCPLPKYDLASSWRPRRRLDIGSRCCACDRHFDGRVWR